MFRWIFKKDKLNELKSISEYQKLFKKFEDLENNIKSYECENFRVDFYLTDNNEVQVFLTPYDKTYDYARFFNTIKSKIKYDASYYILHTEDSQINAIFVGEIDGDKRCVFSKTVINYIINNLQKIILVRSIAEKVLPELNNISNIKDYIKHLVKRIQKELTQIESEDIHKIVWIDILSVFMKKFENRTVSPCEYLILFEYEPEFIQKYFFKS